jgi:hypothetical protein
LHAGDTPATCTQMGIIIITETDAYLYWTLVQ